jgi:hypothetical protein
MYNQGNILGTVSESSGVPTGAIIERGSNANGEYVKYADGTMICQLRQAWSTGAWSSYGSLYQSGVTTWTFPVSFVNTTYAVNIAGDTALFFFSGSNPTTSSASIRIGFSSIPATSRTFTATAIGRWF